MRLFVVHVVTFVAVNAMLAAVWLLAGGDTSVVDEVVNGPDRAGAASAAWPAWVIVAWTPLLLIHLSLVVTRPWRAFTRRYERARAAHRHQRAPHLDHLPARPPPRQRRWVAVLFTDIADSTAHTQRLGDDAWSELLAAHRASVRRAVAARAGTEVGTAGDGFLARFDDPAAAVLAAVDIQRAHDGNPDHPDLALRIGVHAGDAVEDDGDIIGNVVNLAARVMEAAQPGEILVTEPVADKLAVPLDLEDRGLVELKGVGRPRHVLAVRWRADSRAG